MTSKLVPNHYEAGFYTLKSPPPPLKIPLESQNGVLFESPTTSPSCSSSSPLSPSFSKDSELDTSDTLSSSTLTDTSTLSVASSDMPLGRSQSELNFCHSDDTFDNDSIKPSHSKLVRFFKEVKVILIPSRATKNNLANKTKKVEFFRIVTNILIPSRKDITNIADLWYRDCEIQRFEKDAYFQLKYESEKLQQRTNRDDEESSNNPDWLHASLESSLEEWVMANDQPLVRLQPPGPPSPAKQTKALSIDF